MVIVWYKALKDTVKNNNMPLLILTCTGPLTCARIYASAGAWRILLTIASWSAVVILPLLKGLLTHFERVLQLKYLHFSPSPSFYFHNSFFLSYLSSLPQVPFPFFFPFLSFLTYLRFPFSLISFRLTFFFSLFPLTLPFLTYPRLPFLFFPFLSRSFHVSEFLLIFTSLTFFPFSLFPFLSYLTYLWFPFPSSPFPFSIIS